MDRDSSKDPGPNPTGRVTHVKRPRGRQIAQVLIRISRLVKQKQLKKELYDDSYYNMERIASFIDLYLKFFNFYLL